MRLAASRTPPLPKMAVSAWHLGQWKLDMFSITPAIGTFKELSLFFPMAYTADEFVETARALESGDVDPELMVGEVIPLDDLPPTMEALRAGGGKHAKVHVDPRLGG